MERLRVVMKNNRNWHIQMITESHISALNSRIRSFLSPHSKIGTRSHSTSDSAPCLTLPIRKTYIDFRRIARQPQPHKTLQLKLQDFSKNSGSKQQKLFKSTVCRNKDNVNKDRQKPRDRESYKQDETGDLLSMVRDLKQRVVELEKENQILKMVHEEDSIKLRKQNEIISNLEQAINLKRLRTTNSLSLYQSSHSRDQKGTFLNPSPKVEEVPKWMTSGSTNTASTDMPKWMSIFDGWKQSKEHAQRNLEREINENKKLARSGQNQRMTRNEENLRIGKSNVVQRVNKYEENERLVLKLENETMVHKAENEGILYNDENKKVGSKVEQEKLYPRDENEKLGKFLRTLEEIERDRKKELNQIDDLLFGGY